MTFKKAKSCTWVTTTPCNATGLGRSGWKAAQQKMDLSMLVDSQLNVSSGDQESKQYPGLYQKWCGQQQ